MQTVCNLNSVVIRGILPSIPADEQLEDETGTKYYAIDAIDAIPLSKKRPGPVHRNRTNKLAGSRCNTAIRNAVS